MVRFASKCLQLSTSRSYDCTAPPSNDEGAASHGLRWVTAGHPTDARREPAEGVGVAKQKPRHRGAGLSGSVVLSYGLADPSGMQQARHPNAQPHRWFMVAPETSAAQNKPCPRSAVSTPATRSRFGPAHEKAPRPSGAKFFQRGCRVATPGKPTETIPQSIAQRAGNPHEKAPPKRG